MGIRARIAKLVFQLSSSYWFVPGLMTLLAVVLVFVLVSIDSGEAPGWDSPLGWLIGGGADSARSILATIAGSMISVAAVSYSVTFVVLTLASSQFGPRLLQLFMRNRNNQFVLGTFVGAFTYCLILLKMVGNVRGPEFVPQIAILGAFLWALLSLGVLIFFFHSVAETIQAPNVIARVGEDLHRLIRHLYPKEPDRDPPADPEEISRILANKNDWVPVPARSDGYIEVIDIDSLAQLAEQHETTLRLMYRVGDWVLEDSALVEAYQVKPVNEDLRTVLEPEVNQSFILGNRRTPIDDLEFAILQLVEIAVRALSPGINDPYTAVNCIDELGAGLARIVEGVEPARSRAAEDGRPLLIMDRTDFEGIANAAFNEIRQHGGDNLSIVIRLLETIHMLIRRCRTADQRRVLLQHAEMVGRAGLAAAVEERDRQDVESRLERIRAARMEVVLPR